MKKTPLNIVIATISLVIFMKFAYPQQPLNDVVEDPVVNTFSYNFEGTPANASENLEGILSSDIENLVRQGTYNFVYMVGTDTEDVNDDTDVNDDINLDLFFFDSVLGVEPVSNLQDWLSVYNDETVDAIIIHDSALPTLSHPTIADAYWNGTTIVSIDIDPATLATLLDDACLANRGLTPPNSFDINTRVIMSQQANAVSIIRSQWHDNCDQEKPEELVLPTKIYERDTHATITNKKTRDYLTFFTLEHVRTGRTERLNFFHDHN